MKKFAKSLAKASRRLLLLVLMLCMLISAFPMDVLAAEDETAPRMIDYSINQESNNFDELGCTMLDPLGTISSETALLSAPFIPLSGANLPPGAIVQVAAGYYHTVALKNDGTLWAWGDNFNGQLGDGTRIRRNAPVQVGSSTDWASVSARGDNHTLAIRNDGTLWAWGRNDYYQLGLGDATDRHTPVQVGSSTDWASVSAGDFNTLAIRNDGTLWAWGLNNSGQLGLGDTTYRNTPVQVGSSTDWASVSVGGAHTLAIRNDGTLWAWGYDLQEHTCASSARRIKYGVGKRYGEFGFHLSNTQ